jgi:hypothetical protein
MKRRMQTILIAEMEIEWSSLKQRVLSFVAFMVDRKVDCTLRMAPVGL